jgi:hypothetical protein
MKVFICWSGERSKHIAIALRDWIPNVIQGVTPWMSEEDINKGSKWAIELAEQLEKTDFGIACLTPENKSSDWLLYETGSLAKQVKGSFVVPYLYELVPSDLTGPFTLFQMAKATKDETFKVIAAINSGMGDSSLTMPKLAASYEKWWPDLEDALEKIPAPKQGNLVKQTERSNEDLLKEILERVRTLPREISARGDWQDLDRALAGTNASNLATIDSIAAILQNLDPTGNRAGMIINRLRLFLGGPYDQDIVARYLRALENALVQAQGLGADAIPEIFDLLDSFLMQADDFKKLLNGFRLLIERKRTS